MKLRSVTLLFVMLASAASVVSQCSGGSSTPAYAGTFASNGHISGSHSFAGAATEACTYSAPPSDCYQYCSSYSSTTMSVGATDTGVLTALIGYHVSHYSTTDGSQSGTGTSSVSNGTSAVAWEYCLSASCSFTVTSNPISFPADTVFTASQTASSSCAALANPDWDPDCGDGGGGSCCDADQDCVDTCTGSPILIDTTGRGFHLTAPEDGVTFDIAGDGHPVKLSWTSANSGDAFLALDRNHNGIIDNGKELFGNFTAQPPSQNPNGYLALAEFDKPENGGNGDGIIDSRDAVYKDLLLWIDANHDGVSQPNELFHLEDLGVYSIGLSYRKEPLKDQYGNQFRDKGVLNPDAADGTSNDGRYTYDVFFVIWGPAQQANKGIGRVVSLDHVLQSETVGRSSGDSKSILSDIGQQPPK
jgi:hypothetical protein